MIGGNGNRSGFQPTCAFDQAHISCASPPIRQGVSETNGIRTLMQLPFGTPRGPKTSRGTHSSYPSGTVNRWHVSWAMTQSSLSMPVFAAALVNCGTKWPSPAWAKWAVLYFVISVTIDRCGVPVGQARARIAPVRCFQQVRRETLGIAVTARARSPRAAHIVQADAGGVTIGGGTDAGLTRASYVVRRSGTRVSPPAARSGKRMSNPSMTPSVCSVAQSE